MKKSHAFFKPFSTLTLGERIVFKGAVELLDVGTSTLAAIPFYLLPYLCLLRSRWGLVDAVLAAWCVAELMFRVYVYMRVECDGKHRPVPTRQGRALVELARGMFSQMDDPMQLKNWFRSTHVLSKTSLDFLLKQAFFEKQASEFSEAEQLHSDEILAMLPLDLPDLPFDRHESLWQSVNPVPYEVRSIVFYGVMGAIRAMGSVTLRSLDFRFHALPTGLGYWIHRPALPSNQPPILYFHGIGYGPTQMLAHIRSLHDAHPSRTCIVFYLPQIALSPASPVATEQDILAAIDRLFRNERLSRVSAVGHSFGTLVCMWLAKARPAYLAQLTLIDPVCFMAWNACLFKRACHAEPTTMLHHTIRKIISRDHNFSLTISRFMYWPSSFLICHDFPCPTSIFLARHDWVIDAPATFNYLMDRKCSLRQDNVAIHMNDIDHLQFMFTPHLLHQINCCV